MHGRLRKTWFEDSTKRSNQLEMVCLDHRWNRNQKVDPTTNKEQTTVVLYHTLEKAVSSGYRLRKHTVPLLLPDATLLNHIWPVFSWTTHANWTIGPPFEPQWRGGSVLFYLAYFLGIASLQNIDFMECTPERRWKKVDSLLEKVCLI